MAGLAEGADAPDENRTLVTMRLEQLWAYLDDGTRGVAARPGIGAQLFTQWASFGSPNPAEWRMSDAVDLTVVP